jgi:hypothetical protein
MKYNKNSHTDAELCDFVASLPPEHLYWLIVTPPLGDDILEHAVNCAACAQCVQTAADSFYTNLSQQSRLRIGAASRSSRARFDALVETRAFNSGRGGTLELAASDGEADSNETSERVWIAVLKIQGSEFEALEGSEGNVYLRGQVPPRTTQIWFGQDAFKLVRCTASGEFEVENLGSVDLEQFLARHQDDPEKFPIRFAD